MCVHATAAADCEGVDDYPHGPDHARQSYTIHNMGHLYRGQHGSIYMELGENSIQILLIVSCKVLSRINPHK